MIEKLESTEILFLPMTSEEENAILLTNKNLTSRQSTYQPTSISSKSSSLKKIIAEVYKDFSKEFQSISETMKAPSEINLELSMKFNQKLGIWIANFEGEGSVKVVIKWELNGEDTKK